MEVKKLGLIGYKEAYTLQLELLAKRKTGDIPDTLLLLEHPPIITLGRSGDKKNIINPGNMEVLEIDRGGDVTCHFPGQIVGYPIMDLKNRGKDVHAYLKDLEEVIIEFLKLYKVNGERKKGFTGVYVKNEKICSIGVGVKSWISYHGFAVNIESNTSCFDGVVPCGIPQMKVTSLEKQLNKKLNKNDVLDNIILSFNKVFALSAVKSLGTPLKKKVSLLESKDEDTIRRIIKEKKLNTVCVSAVCPNINECFKSKAVTFMLLGDVCTRNCRFCGVKKGEILKPDVLEPKKIAEAVSELGLRYVVLTSVTRDDLEDGGAGIFAGAVTEIKKDNPGVKVEVLISDLKGDEAALRIIVESKPEVLAHNVEIVPSLYSKIRPEAVYARSLKLLKKAKAMDRSIKTKSGLMLGLGEKKEEVVEVLKDLRKAGVDIVTIGQYLSPDRACVPVVRHLASEEFEDYKKTAESMGFSGVASGTFVRSSYNAENLTDLTGKLH